MKVSRFESPPGVPQQGEKEAESPLGSGLAGS